MLCYMGRSFCSAADQCATLDCSRRLTEEDRERGRRWWATVEATDPESFPVCYSDFSARCPDYQPVSGAPAEELTDGR